MATIQELLRQREELERAIAVAQADSRKSALREIQEIMATHGLSVADLTAGGRKSSRGEKRSKVPAKFVNRQTGESWSGRGLQPRWLKAAMASGATLDQFAISKSD